MFYFPIHSVFFPHFSSYLYDLQIFPEFTNTAHSFATKILLVLNICPFMFFTACSGLNCGSPKGYVHEKTCEYDFRKMIFAEVTKLRYLKWDLSGFRVGPKTNNTYPFIRNTAGHLRPRDARQKDTWRWKKRLYLCQHSQGIQGAIRSWKGKEGFPLRAFGKECSPDNTLILNFWPPSEP